MVCSGVQLKVPKKLSSREEFVFGVICGSLHTYRVYNFFVASFRVDIFGVYHLELLDEFWVTHFLGSRC